MKLIVMIPCYNEEKTLPLVIKSIPKKIKKIRKIEILVVDDGSTDKTVQVAKKHKVNHIIQHSCNKGLARAFETGLQACLDRKADIIVNTDGDNQYPQQDIPRLIQPILEGKAQIVIADRQTHQIAHFSPLKKILQKFGSWVVQMLSGVNVPDAVSGFRAYSAEAAKQLYVVTDFSYVIETIIQAGKKKIPVTSVAVITNPKTRESRLAKNMWSHVKRSASTIVRVFAMYEPLKTFSFLGFLLLLPALVLIGRFIYYYLLSGGAGHVQSLVLGGALLAGAIQMFALAILADLVCINRHLIERNNSIK